MTDCLFCRIISKEIPSDIIYEDDAVVAFLDIHPVNPGHTLLVPKEHSEETTVAGEAARGALGSALVRLAPAIVRATGSGGWNLEINSGAVAGQVVRHTHWHLIPRRAGDGLVHWPGRETTAEERAQVADAVRAALAA